MVVYAHLLPNVADVGKAAVAGFFILSSFLITPIVNRRYSDWVRGFGIFVLNRALRIFPTFWVCLAFAFAAIALLLVYVFWQEPIGIYIYLETRSMDEIARVLPSGSIWIFYGTLPFAALAMWATLAVRVDDSSVLTGSKLAKVSEYLGELSYPVFLLHFAMLILVTGLLGGTGGQGPERVLWHSLVAIPLVYILAMLVVRFVEQPVQRLRDKVRDLTDGRAADPRIKNVHVP